MTQAINAYHSVVVSPEFKEYERLRSRARHDEAQALKSAERRGEQRGEERANEKWQGVATENEQLRAQIAELQSQINKDNRVGGQSLVGCPSSHTTVRTVRYTAVQ
jgi:hypothetical protein